jgi:RNA polymerase sigma-70 factor (ECF subfamily)
LSPDAELQLLECLRAGDEQAFVALVGTYHDSMLRLARSFVPSRAVAEEVVQDTWLGVLRGIGGFEGRSSFKTWIFRILVNRARSTGVREHRSIPIGGSEAAVDASRFDGTGQWASPPDQWFEDVEDRVRAGELRGRIREALEELPSHQREVVTLRDVEGLSSEEVCEVLEITEGNQRVLLHRGRSRLRQALEIELRRM